MTNNQKKAPLILVLGGARSGKSSYAEALLKRLTGDLIYLATAEPRDGEMEQRIDQHRDRRGDGWKTIEAPIDIAAALRGTGQSHGVLLDCLTLWLSNVMEKEGDPSALSASLLRELKRRDGPVVMVSNELGMGLVPETPLGRAFRDAQGRLNQEAAAAADIVIFVAAGLPLVLKGEAL